MQPHFRYKISFWVTDVDVDRPPIRVPSPYEHLVTATFRSDLENTAPSRYLPNSRYELASKPRSVCSESDEASASTSRRARSRVQTRDDSPPRGEGSRCVCCARRARAGRQPGHAGVPLQDTHFILRLQHLGLNDCTGVCWNQMGRAPTPRWRPAREPERRTGSSMGL